MQNIIDGLRKKLIEFSDEERKLKNQYFFKEDVKFHGLTNPKTHEISKQFSIEIKKLSKKDVFNLCEELWKSGFMEEAIIACNWSYLVHKKYEESDIEIFENWIEKYVTNWATCDTFCNHTVGEFLEMFPNYISKLKEWAKSENRWMKRAAAVSLIVPGKKGLFLNDIFEIADILLLDKDDLVQKGYGWMLKSASHSYQNEIFEYVMSKKAIMPRTSLRYAIEKMPNDLKTKAMEKF
jgi:3-methyladenine DNA glycosylase AlkD